MSSAPTVLRLRTTQGIVAPPNEIVPALTTLLRLFRRRSSATPSLPSIGLLLRFLRKCDDVAVPEQDPLKLGSPCLLLA